MSRRSSRFVALAFVLASTLVSTSASAQGRMLDASGSRVTKLLIVMEENHSLDEMRAQMPYTFALASQYAYASSYRAITHPSLPNYLAIAGGSTFGVTGDGPPSTYGQSAPSVFGRAVAAGGTAKVYAEDMSTPCQQRNAGEYAVRHNPWTYFVTASEHHSCLTGDVPIGGLTRDVASGALPTVGMVVPNLCHDAHNCSLATADVWFQTLMAPIMAGPDFSSGRLAVVLVADEDDRTQSNTVLAAVIQSSLKGQHKVVDTPLTHYSLTRMMQDVAHSTPYVRNAATANDMAAAFGLRVG